MTPSSAPTSAVWSSPTVIESRTPATGEGISVSTLSVDTSTSGSSAATVSPTLFSQRVTVPSVTLSPRAGSTTDVGAPPPVGALGGASAWAGTATGSAACSAGVSAAGSATGAAGSTVDGVASLWAAAGALSGVGSASGVSERSGASFASPMTASSAPTATVSSTWARMRSSTPVAGAGISVSTLSVETSSSGSSLETGSPSFFSHRVTVPSVTLSPSRGIFTETDIAWCPFCGGQEWAWRGLPASARCASPMASL